MTNYSFDISRKRIRNIGKCIYCYRSDIPLSEEHIIPFGLNGNFTLLNASCPKCAERTSIFEGDVLKNAFNLLRVGLKMHSRHSKYRFIKVQFKANNQPPISIEISRENAPIIIALPIFLPPAILSPRQYTNGIQSNGQLFVKEIRGISKENIHPDLGHGTINIPINYQPVNLAKMIAKIAYSASVGVFGLENIRDTGIISAIMGETDNIGWWVGNDGENTFPRGTGLHNVSFEFQFSLDPQDTNNHVVLICRVRLLSIFELPEYKVVVGELEKQLVDKIGEDIIGKRN